MHLILILLTSVTPCFSYVVRSVSMPYCHVSANDQQLNNEKKCQFEQENRFY